MHDDVTRTTDDEPSAGPAQPEPTTPATHPSVLSVVIRQVATLAGAALLLQATWGTWWVAGVVGAVLLLEWFIVWDLRHQRQR